MRKQFLVSDKSGDVIDGRHYTLRLISSDGRSSNFEADLTEEEAKAIQRDTNARAVARRGRRPRVQQVA